MDFQSLFPTDGGDKTIKFPSYVIAPVRYYDSTDMLIVTFFNTAIPSDLLNGKVGRALIDNHLDSTNVVTDSCRHLYNLIAVRKLPSSPYINRFLSPDTIVPGVANPQAFNRYSYVLNNPIRYNDPTGHMCSDPDDPSPSCDGGGGYPVNQTPLPSAPVVINNPGPLDEGQEQDDPTPTPDVTVPPCDAICQAVNWYYQNISAYQYTPIAMSSIQFVTGTWMLWLEPAMAFPPTAEVAIPLYILSFAENRAASLVAWQAVDYQYDHGLYGVSKMDVFIAGGSLFAGAVIPPLAPFVSDVSFVWDIFHTNWKDFP